MILWIIITIIVFYYVIGFILPSTITIANSLKMSGQSDSVYTTISNFKNWEDWAIWNDDRTLRITLSEPSNQVGARYRWRSKIRELKDGLIVLTEANAPTELHYEWYYGRHKRGTILFNIEELDNCCFVTCSLTIHNSKKIFARYLCQFIKRSIHENIEEILLKIDERSM